MACVRGDGSHFTLLGSFFFETNPQMSSHPRFSSASFSVFHICAEIGPLFRYATDNQALEYK